MPILDEGQTRKLIEALTPQDIASLKEVQLAFRRSPRATLLHLAISQIAERDPELATKLLNDLARLTDNAAAAGSDAAAAAREILRESGLR